MKPLRVLFLTPTPVGDRSFGGAIRSSDLRQALIGVAEVDTLVIEGGPGFVLEPNWNDDRVRRLTHTARGASLRGLRETARVRCVVGELLKASPYDFIVARYLGQAMYVPKGEWGRRLIIDPDDVYKSLSDPSPSLWARIKVGLRNEMVARLLRRARHVWIVNPVDATRLKLRRASMLGNIVVVPPLVRPRPPVVPNRVLMVGFFPHPPNAEGLRWFSTEVLPALRRHYPDLQLHAVGKPPPDLTSSAALVVRGYVADLAAEYASAALVIAPIFAGAGSQIKVIDALAHERPLVASNFALASFTEHLRPDSEVLVADAVQGWIDRCLQVLARPSESEQMANRGYEAVRENFGFEAMAREVRLTFESLAREAGRS